MTKPRVGISACLLGQKVRHNGEHKRNDWIVDRLGRFVSWVPICPEVEMGLGVPRDTMRLVGNATQPRLIVIRTGEDLTDRALETAQRILSRDLDLDGFIFKKDSPSCGLERVKVYGKSGMPIKNGSGFFAAALKEKYQDLPIPMIEEGRLSDDIQREGFLIQLFAWHPLRKLEPKISSLQKFHESQKLLLMSMDPNLYRRLGNLAANSERNPPKEVLINYQRLFLEAFKRPPSVKKRINALQHMLGYFKKVLDSEEKKSLLEKIEEYREGDLPLIVILTLFQYLSRKHSIEYLKQQSILSPYPKGLT